MDPGASRTAPTYVRPSGRPYARYRVPLRPTMLVSGSSLCLKRHVMENLEKIHRWRVDPEINEMSRDRPFSATVEETIERLNTWISQNHDSDIHVGVHRAIDDLLIGFGQIAFIDRHSKTCHLGIVIGEKSLWNQGHGTEAVKLIADFCFTELNLNRIMCEAYDTNIASQKMLQNAGFRLEGILRENIRKGDRFIDEHLFGLIRSDRETSRNS